MTLFLGFAAVNTGNNLLYLLVSALLGFMAVSGWLGQQNLRNLLIKLTLPQEIFAGQPTLIGVCVQNRRHRLPAFLIRVHLGADFPLFPQISARGTEEQSLMLNWSRRGQQQLKYIWIDSCFPINFFVRSLRIEVNQELLVFPQPQRTQAPTVAGYHAQRHQLARSVSGDSGDLRGIHDYRGGEPLKAIHWKLSARHNSLKVKQHEGLGAEPIVIDIAQLAGATEEKLRRATGLMLEQFRHQRPVGLKLNGRFISPQSGNGQRRRLLTELALYHGR
ncbi:DUF58 domain-containing protein [Geopsychrobacter electrodiphilus]|uniref:DUF58 domain-containing protein n=1 Tax=Geopsychrobacter electrodiphilus TaxID=225196 RepID=UPI00146AEEF2|nr:DUF58 domain-containing protein [Geopsychrobacter electrodiphilus]